MRPHATPDPSSSHGPAPARAATNGQPAASGQSAEPRALVQVWGQGESADVVLGWWTEFSAGIRGEIVGAQSVKDANEAIRKRFAAIFVRSPKGGCPRLDFVLRERPPGSPLVASRMWIDDEDAMIRQFEVTNQGGVQRKVRLTSLKTNVPVDASAFVFTPPAGVRIVSR